MLALVGVQIFITNKAGSEEIVRSTIDLIGQGTPHFVALEYYFGILNRTYVVFVTDTMIYGAKVRGLLPAPINVGERWRNPYFYPKLSYLKRLTGFSVHSSEFLNQHNANFQIERSEIQRVEWSNEEKWGMGTVPYSGRIVVILPGNRTRELIFSWLARRQRD